MSISQRSKIQLVVRPEEKAHITLQKLFSAPEPPLFDDWVRVVGFVEDDDIQHLGRECYENNPCTLAIATAIYMEEPYLLEWIIYHLLMGVEHFYFVHMISLTLASRLSQNATFAVLKPFMDRGVVTMSTFMGIYDSPQLLEQVEAMRTSLMRYRRFSRWLINLDPDEFYYSEAFPHLMSLVHHASRAPVSVDAYPVPWYMFGASGHERRPSGLAIENYVRRTRHLIYDGETPRWFGRLNGKVLFRTACLSAMPSPHRIELKPNCFHFEHIPNVTEAFHLKHYQTKSYQDWMWKRHASGFTGYRTNEPRPDAKPGYWNSVNRNWKKEWAFTDAMFNDTLDLTMSVYWPVMRKLMRNEVSQTGWCKNFTKVYWAPLSCF